MNSLNAVKEGVADVSGIVGGFREGFNGLVRRHAQDRTYGDGLPETGRGHSEP
ncbi:MAG: hypothetical protein MZU91_04840 [Desulfosudis oleivorans]|nr:hypothetical protein [Desulfosudis oleivorans]